MAENEAGATGGDTGDTGDTGSDDVMTTEQASDDLNEWANSEPKSNGRERSQDGKFKSNADEKEVGRVLKATVKQASRPAPKEEDEEESEAEEEVEEEKPRRPKGAKVKAIVNGKEEEIDLDDEEFQKVNAVQASRAAQKAWREAAEMRREANQLKQALTDARKQVRQDPMALFRALGIPEEEVYGFAQNKTIEKLSETIDPNTGQPYTPEQQRIIQLQKELQNKNMSEQQRQQAIEAAEHEQMKDSIRKDIDRKFTTALQETGLPATPHTMMRLAELMESMGPDVDPQTVAPLVLEDMVNEVRTAIYSMPMDVAAEVLGEEWMADLRKWDMAQARKSKDKFGRNPQQFPKNSSQRAPAKGQSKGRDMTTDQAQDFLEKWAEGN